MKQGFTLAELLIALAILGVIATFTIPKVLQSQRDGRYNAVVKETAAAMVTAFDAYKQANGLNANIHPYDLTPYLNYIAMDTVSPLDRAQGMGSWNCDNTYPCVRMHNGALLSFGWEAFGGTTTTDMIYFYVDPDGKVTDGTTNGPGKSVVFFMFTNDRLNTWGTVPSPNNNWSSSYTADPSKDPPWFSWGS